MAAASDDLTRPLGVEPTRRGGFLSRLPFGRIALSLLVAGVTGAGLYALVYGDAWGGRPRIVVPIKVAEALAPATPAPASRTGAPAQTAERRREGVDVEVTSGVSVVRPQSAAPGGLLIRVPDAAMIRLAPAPDPRLVEQNRLGPLPKIGPDGSRSASIYARPAGALPGGVTPIARIAILVGGLGVNPAVTSDAIAKLPDAVTLSFAPYGGGDLSDSVAQAREAGHEVMLQMPMEPLDYPATDPGPQTLTTAAKPAENLERLRWGMSRFTGFVGVSNFLGGKLTADEAALAPILREIGARGLLFVDDGSSSRSASGAVAESLQIRAARADLVIDPVPRSELIDRALERLEASARETGFALGSASALPLSVERIARWAETLEKKGILLVPVSASPARETKR